MKKAAVDIIRAMILPLFDQGDVFYHGATQTNLNKLQVLKNRAGRIACKVGRLEIVQEESKKINIASLVKKRKIHLAQLAMWMARVNIETTLKLILGRTQIID